MALSPKLPTLNQLITLAIAMAIIMFALRFAPENIKSFFRV